MRQAFWPPQWRGVPGGRSQFSAECWLPLAQRRSGGGFLLAPTISAGSDGVLREPGFVDASGRITQATRGSGNSASRTRIFCGKCSRITPFFVVHTPSDYFLAPLLTRATIWSLALEFLVTVGIFSGIVRLSRNREWKSIEWVFPFYLALILVWNYPNTARFASCSLPLFAAGLWFEAKHFLALAYTTITKKSGSKRKGSRRSPRLRGPGIDRRFGDQLREGGPTGFG